MDHEFKKIPATNYINNEAVDRIYGGGHLRLSLIQKDGQAYDGKISKKTIMVTSAVDGSRFKSYVYVTEDNRWFDRSGLPISKPGENNLVNDEE